MKANAWDLSINRYKQVVYEQVKYATPAELINGGTDPGSSPGLRQLAAERVKLLDELEALLK